MQVTQGNEVLGPEMVRLQEQGLFETMPGLRPVLALEVFQPQQQVIEKLLGLPANALPWAASLSAAASSFSPFR